MESTTKLGFTGLVALVFSMMVGAGIFNLPQNMALSAGPGASIVAWVLTAGIILTLVYTFKLLADRHPELNAGIYQYAQAGWGNYAGFNMAWGYWLSACFANVAYTVMLSDTAGAFFPVLLKHGWQMVVVASSIVVVMYFAVSTGLKTVKVLNMCISVFKIAAIGLIIALLAIYMKMGVFTADFWSGPFSWGSMWGQVRGSMLVTLWCFIGVEGAVMVSSRARNARDIGRAGVTGCILAWILYLLVSVLSYGVMSQARLAGLHDPSAAYLLRAICGDWAYYVVIATVTVAVIGGLVAWTLVLGEVAREAALVKVFPSRFATLNRHGMPQYALGVSSILMIAFIILVAMADDVYLAALSITGMMVLPAYFVSGLYLLKLVLRGDGGLTKGRRMRQGILAACCVAGMGWMMYAGGVQLLLATSVFYIMGIPFFLRARRQYTPKGKAPVGRRFWIVAGLLVVAAVVSALL